MDEAKKVSGEDQIIVGVIHTQLEYFRNLEPPCRALELPEGILLRYNLSRSLYFYLKTSVIDGKTVTLVFASDSPYDRKKALIGEIRTPMFEKHGDRKHFEELEDLLRFWIDFVKDEPGLDRHFSSFPLGERPS